MPKIPGIAFDFGGGQVYIVPPLALGNLQMLQDKLTAMTGVEAMNPASIATVLDATHAALVRNYPDMTREKVGQLVDLGNMFEVIGCVMDVTGAKRKSSEDAEKNQQAQAATPAPTGLPSSPKFAQTPDGPGTTSESISTFPP